MTDSFFKKGMDFENWASLQSMSTDIHQIKKHFECEERARMTPEQIRRSDKIQAVTGCFCAAFTILVCALIFGFLIYLLI